MDTNRLRQFEVVSKMQNMRRAAEIIGISHSGLSKSIRALEEDFGFELIEAQGRGIVITDRGKSVAKQIPEILKSIDHLRTDVKAPQRLRIGTFEVFSTYFVRELNKAIFDAEVELNELGPGALEKALSDHQIDLGITYEPIPASGCEFIEVSKIKMSIYGLKKWQNVPFEKLPFVVPLTPVTGSPTGVKGLDGWPSDRIERRIRYRVDLMMSAIEFTRSGESVVFLPDFIARLHNETVRAGLRLEKISMPSPASSIVRKVYIVRRTGATETSLVRAVARELRKLK